MTFQEFQATRKWADDLTKVDGIDLGSDGPLPGYHYAGLLHIFVLGKSGYVLTIANVDEYGETPEDLIDLERKLYDWGRTEGVID